MRKKLNILVAPSAYKGSYSAQEVAKAIISGITEITSNIDLQFSPLADGGDGTLDSIHSSLGGTIHQVNGIGSDNEAAIAKWLELNDMAIIELAQCCGIAMIHGKPLQPLLANTYGLGLVIKLCLSESCSKIMIGLGGSASTDGGTGALAALGIKFFDQQNKLLPLGGGYLSQLSSIDVSTLDKRVLSKDIELLADVNSPLLGTEGAAFMFGPQKGAGSKEIQLLEAGLLNFANIVKDLTKIDLRNISGAGAAGGTAFGFAALLNAQIISGFSKIAQLTNLNEKIANADLVITGEGNLDLQSVTGKATGELAKLCQNLGKPLFVISGSAQEGIQWQNFGIRGVYPAAHNNVLAYEKDIGQAAQKIIKLFQD